MPLPGVGTRTRFRTSAGTLFGTRDHVCPLSLDWNTFVPLAANAHPADVASLPILVSGRPSLEEDQVMP